MVILLIDGDVNNVVLVKLFCVVQGNQFRLMGLCH
jgi:hypothetical protein